MSHKSLATDAASVDYAVLLSELESILGRLLSASDVNTVLYLSDVLDFEPARIKNLYLFCNKKSFFTSDYVLKVAETWKLNGTFCEEDIKNIIIEVSPLLKAIYDVFSIPERMPYPSEVTYVERWEKEWGMDNMLILHACKKTVKNINSPSFAYTEQILLSFKGKGIHTYAEYEQQYKPAAISESKRANSFRNFNERHYDFEQLEKEAFNNAGN